MKSKIEIYNGSSLIKTLEGNELYGGVNFYKNINASTDLQLGQVSSAQVSFTTTYASITKSHTFKYYTFQECDTAYRLIGIYYIDRIDKDRKFYTITGYDCISLLDQDISDWLQNTCTATTVTQLFSQICTKCGLTSGTGSFLTNTNMPIDPKEIATPGITARTVMGYIAEATASFVYTRDDNLVHCYTYLSATDINRAAPAATKSTLTASDYVNLNMARETAPQITNVAVNTINGAYQSNSATPSATMSFIYNPLFYKKSTSQLNSYIKNGVKTIVANIGAYYPCTFKCFCDYKLRCGDIINVNDGISNKKVLIMSMRISESGCEFECIGQHEREPFVLQNTDRITNLESSKFNIDEWTSSSSGKEFNSSLMVNDLLIPSGLGYTGNTNNVSLVNVIQYILSQIGTVEINMSGNANGHGALNHTYTTEYDNTWSYSISSGAGLTVTRPNTVYVITCTNSQYGAPTSGTVTFTKNGQTKRVNCTCYTAVGNVCSSPSQSNYFYMWFFPPEIDYYTTVIRSKVRLSSTTGDIIYNDTNSGWLQYDENAFLWRDYDASEAFHIGFKRTGTYFWEVWDSVHSTKVATWKFLIV